MPVAKHSDLGKLLALGVFFVQTGGVRFGDPENQNGTLDLPQIAEDPSQGNILYDVRTPPTAVPSSEGAPSGLYTPLHMISSVSIKKVLGDLIDRQWMPVEAILSPSIVDKQSLGSRWLSRDSEDFEAKSRIAAGGDLAMQELRRLIVEAGDPSKLNGLRSSGILGTARTLMSRESSTDELK
ncbi:hypothetical protein FOZ62_001326, partial [Perkinsus olseni]